MFWLDFWCCECTRGRFDELSLAQAKPRWFADFPTLNGFVLDKSQTPFAPLFSDFYEEIKPAAR